MAEQPAVLRAREQPQVPLGAGGPRRAEEHRCPGARRRSSRAAPHRGTHRVPAQTPPRRW
ncbi:hypothetical protein [Streptomyces sp. BPTC-684]|uniref:hypothetical protein n=1 Tax=Streptomyces sp. BPTC-684 TaxID=3043734 RepID=UPI0024B0EDCB|nr:hypothetical protein [Streptomyces sp. BPTC-684]WHM41554.1 hypothetical protein QIY60_22990 [Streptomyces sp. BPTC-684]